MNQSHDRGWADKFQLVKWGHEYESITWAHVLVGRWSGRCWGPSAAAIIQLHHAPEISAESASPHLIPSSDREHGSTESISSLLLEARSVMAHSVQVPGLCSLLIQARSVMSYSIEVSGRSVVPVGVGRGSCA
jgi:hypothetical protein